MKDVKIYAESEHTVNINNEGMNEDNLLFAKRTMMFNAIRNHTDLITEENFYPEKDMEKIMLILDIVILDRSRYNRLLEAEKRLVESINFTDKPKLKA